MLEAMILAALVIGGASLTAFDIDVPEAEKDPGEEPQRETEPTEGSDRLQLGDEADNVSAGRGNDQVSAGSGDDTVSGGPGLDILLGEAGQDELSGGEFHDILLGGDGADLLNGDGGKDILFGGSGDDTVLGGDWDDVISGGEGSDHLSGGRGNDNIFGVQVVPEPEVSDLQELRDGEESAANLFALEADDEADVLDGGDGHDYLALGSGDTATGGSGRDIFDLHLMPGSSAVAVIEDFVAGEDSVRVSGEGNFSVEHEEETGDSLILEDGNLVARLTGAGESFSLQQLEIAAGV
ncbi:calcium-binding protein [Leisingera sp. ANG-M1]|uniref:calcium-binding protein n=1 Tax=Leisingera sp. ANG-M1 TaxID=1577895 RepID=UPI00068EFB17|nr:calcium-binding protein [Leisingera sp. ANG-M1]